jgi:hypothetical protein
LFDIYCEIVAARGFWDADGNASENETVPGLAQEGRLITIYISSSFSFRKAT